jgi:NADH dehydrogenase
MGEKLGRKAAARLEKLGVEIQLEAMVTDVDRNGITVKHADGNVERIECATKVWSAGVSASPLGSIIAEQSGAETDRSGRVKVLPDLTVPGHPNVFIVGDMAAIEGVPGQAQGAIQGARYAAKLIKAELRGADPTVRPPFQYFDKGSMATVSRFSAVAQVGPLEFGGFIAWLAWLFLHLIYLVGFRARLTTALSWVGTFIGSQRGQLTITEQQAYARTRIEQLEEIAATVEDAEKATA